MTQMIKIQSNSSTLIYPRACLIFKINDKNMINKILIKFRLKAEPSNFPSLTVGSHFGFVLQLIKQFADR